MGVHELILEQLVRLGQVSAIWKTSFWEDSTVPSSFYLAEELLAWCIKYALDQTTPPELSGKAFDL